MADTTPRTYGIYTIVAPVPSCEWCNRPLEDCLPDACGPRISARRKAERIMVGGDGPVAVGLNPAQRQQLAREAAEDAGQTWPPAWVTWTHSTVYLDDSFERLEISIRAYRTLKNLECKTVRDVTGLSAKTLFKMHNCGRLTVKEIRTELARHGYALKGESRNG